MKKRIGTYHLKEDKVFRNTFECAAWYEDVLVKAGDYPIYVLDCKTLEDGEIRSYPVDGAYVEMEGAVKSDYFGGQFCGKPIGGDYDSTQNAGKSSNHSLFSYLVFVAYSILHEADSPWELSEQYEAREIPFTDIKGQPKTTYGIFSK